MRVGCELGGAVTRLRRERRLGRRSRGEPGYPTPGVAYRRVQRSLFGGSPVGGFPIGESPVGGSPIAIGGSPIRGSPIGGAPIGGSPIGDLHLGIGIHLPYISYIHIHIVFDMDLIVFCISTLGQ